MSAMASQITSFTIVYSTVYSEIKEHIKAPRHWPFCGEFTGDRWIPRKKASNAEIVSIWWRHHDLPNSSRAVCTPPPNSPLMASSMVLPCNFLYSSNTTFRWSYVRPVRTLKNPDSSVPSLPSPALYSALGNQKHYIDVIMGVSVSNHQRHDCLLKGLFRRRWKKTWNLRVTGLCAGNSAGTGEFPAQMASNAENVSIWWRHHEYPDIIGLHFITVLQFSVRSCKWDNLQ